MRKDIFLNLVVLSVLAACQRTALSPLELKLDEDIGGYATAESVNTYTVQRDETLFDIANRFNLDPMKLAASNNISAPYKVHEGQVLKLPPVNIEPENEKVLYSPVAVQEELAKNEVAQKADAPDELDEKFNRMMQNTQNQSKKKEEDSNKAVAASTGQSFNEQENSLMSPKVTQTAKGGEIKAADTASQVKSSTTATSTGKVRPVEGKVISKFKADLDGIPNDGINIKAPLGTPVKSVADGEVIYAGNGLDDSFGNVVVVKHKDGAISSYANLQNISTKQGAKLKAGQSLGSVGKTGDVSEPQLHFEVMRDTTPIDPEKYLSGK